MLRIMKRSWKEAESLIPHEPILLPSGLGRKRNELLSCLGHWHFCFIMNTQTIPNQYGRLLGNLLLFLMRRTHA